MCTGYVKVKLALNCDNQPYDVWHIQVVSATYCLVVIFFIFCSAYSTINNLYVLYLSLF